MSEQKQQQEVKVTFPEHLKGGVYCNSMFVAHSREEFIMDFLMVAPPAGSVVSRVVMSPGHMKRVVAALQDNITKYEKNIGKIQEAAEPVKGKIGFHTP